MKPGMLPALFNVLLGATLVASVFLWDRTATDTMMIGGCFGPLIIVFSAMSLMYRGARFGATAAALSMIVITPHLEHYIGNHAELFEIAMGVVVFLVSLVPNAEIDSPSDHVKIAGS